MKVTRRQFLEGIGKLGIAFAASQLPKFKRNIELVADNFCPKNTAYALNNQVFLHPSNLNSFNDHLRSIYSADIINHLIPNNTRLLKLYG